MRPLLLARLHTLSVAALCLVAFALLPSTTAARPDITIAGILYSDTNCNGTREAGEPLITTYRVRLIYFGNDGVPHTTDDSVVEDIGSTSGAYQFGVFSPEGTYGVQLSPSSLSGDYRPAPLGPDNALTMPTGSTSYWITTPFQMNPNATVTQNLGVCAGAPADPLTWRVYLPLAVRS